MARRSRARRRGGLALASIALLCAGLGPVLADAAPGTAVAFDALAGFTSDDLAAALRTFRVSCAESTHGTRPLRSAAGSPPALRAACAALPARNAGAANARVFFERHFEPRRLTGDAFFTGYYEPVVEGSLLPTKVFATPLYAAPAGLVTVRPGATPHLDPALNAARRLADGRLVAMPDRAAIETGALGKEGRPLAYVASPADAFFIQVQGSARIRMRDGRLRRLVFAGRNGYPYTSIGKLLVIRLNIPPSAMGMSQLRAWIRDHGQGPNDAGTALMRENRSFIFFAFDPTLPSGAGPIGGAGVSLTPLRSLAIDRSIWPYGMPFYIDTSTPDGRPFRRLMVAQDTGAAILGATRADIFFGTGSEAARAAGPMRQSGTLYVLWPKEPAEARRAGRR